VLESGRQAKNVDRKDSDIDGKNDIWLCLEMGFPRDVCTVSQVNGVAVAVWASSVSAQNLDHTKAIGTEPFTIGHILHCPPHRDTPPLS